MKVVAMCPELLHAQLWSVYYCCHHIESHLAAKSTKQARELSVPASK